ncbi:MAG: hypothetical protein A4E28_00722 [Methanocella sp. PtaU1.Bin125]|nr:MAG: hypothetical protein A4E28_00722 [Methanocella sp. PtaU1.Bin125]
MGLKITKVSEISPPEPVDRLVVVADHANVTARVIVASCAGVVAGELLDQLELGVVGVLELVDQDVGVASPVRVQHEGLLREEPGREVDHVVEVDERLFPLIRLVGPVHLEHVLQLAGEVPFVLVELPRFLPAQVRFQVVRRDQLVPERADAVDHRLDDLLAVVAQLDVLEAEPVDVLQAPDQLAGPADDARREADARVQNVVLQHLEAERVKRADGELRGVDFLLQPVAHLLRGLIRKRQRQDMLRLHPAPNQVQYFLRDHFRLAGPWPRQDQLAAVLFDRLCLRRVQRGPAAGLAAAGFIHRHSSSLTDVYPSIYSNGA